MEHEPIWILLARKFSGEITAVELNELELLILDNYELKYKSGLLDKLSEQYIADEYDEISGKSLKKLLDKTRIRDIKV